MHGMGIVHGDVKAVGPSFSDTHHALMECVQTNVMIDDEGHVKLIDFGLSRLIDSEDGLTTATGLSVRWFAPELFISENGRATKASDVYAFASTALEVSLLLCWRSTEAHVVQCSC